MYKVKLTGNFNVCINDLNTVFTYNRPEKIFSDSEFENSEDLKRYIGKFLEAEYIDISRPKSKPQKLEITEKPVEVKTKVEEVDDKTRFIIETKETDEDKIVKTEDVLSDETEKEIASHDDEIVVADGKSSEKFEIAKDDENSVRMDNFGNTVKNTEVAPVKEPEAKAQNVEKPKKSAKKKTTKITLNKRS